MQVVTSGIGPTYSVTFTGNVSNQGLYIHRDTATLNLGGSTYTVTGVLGGNSFMLGQNSGETGSLTLTNGTLVTSQSNTSFYSAIGNVAGSVGTVNLQSGAMWTDSGEERIGQAGTGTFNQTGGTHTVGADLVLGGNSLERVMHFRSNLPVERA